MVFRKIRNKNGTCFDKCQIHLFDNALMIKWIEFNTP